MHTNTLLLIAGSGVTAICATLMPSSLYAQIPIGQSSPNTSGIPLSQQTLQEMQPSQSKPIVQLHKMQSQQAQIRLKRLMQITV